MTFSVWVLLSLMGGHALSYTRRTVLRRRARRRNADERAAAFAAAAAAASKSGGHSNVVAIDLNDSVSGGPNMSVHSFLRTAGA